MVRAKLENHVNQNAVTDSLLEVDEKAMKVSILQAPLPVKH